MKKQGPREQEADRDLRTVGRESAGPGNQVFRKRFSESKWRALMLANAKLQEHLLIGCHGDSKI